MIATIDLEACARTLENRAYRLIGVAGQHRAKLLREKDDPDVRLQRGNASSFSHTEGVVFGIVEALRAFGFTNGADQVEYALDEMCGEVVPADAADRITPERIAELETEAGFEEWSS